MLPIHYGLNYDLAVVKPLEEPGAQIEAINFQAERCAKRAQKIAMVLRGRTSVALGSTAKETSKVAVKATSKC